MNKKLVKQLLYNALIFGVLMIITFWVVLKDQDFSSLPEILKSIKPEYFAVGVAMMMGFVSMEAMNIMKVLKSFGEKTTFWRSFKHTLIGFFFAGVTPSATGGQPMEVYAMTRDGITAGHGALALLVQVCGIQISIISLGLLGLIFRGGSLSGTVLMLVFIGILFNGAGLAIMLIAIFSPRLTRKFVNLIVSIIKLIGFKKIEKWQEKIDHNLDEYAKGSVYIKSHKRLFIDCIIRVILQYSFYFSIPFFVYKAFGLSGAGFFEIFFMQALVFLATSALPIPGAVGASEATFFDIFGTIFGQNLVRGATLLSRIITFYGLMLISMIVVFVNNLRTSKPATSKPTTLKSPTPPTKSSQFNQYPC